MGTMNASIIDTTPGKEPASPFSPPAGWSGNADDYMELMRQRYKDLMFGQRLRFIASFARKNRVTVSGPYTDAAKKIISSIMKNNSARTLPRGVA